MEGQLVLMTLVESLESARDVGALMPVVASISTLSKGLPRSDFAALSDLILQAHAVRQTLDVPEALATMHVAMLVKLHSAAPSLEHFDPAFRSFASECARQGYGFYNENRRMLTELVDAKNEADALADIEITFDDEKDDLDRAIHEAKKDPRWPDISAVLAAIKRSVKF